MKLDPPATAGGSDSLPWVVRPFRVTLKLRWIKIHFAQIAGRVSFCLIVEVLRSGISAFSSGSHRDFAHLWAKLNHGNEAVAAGAVDLL